MFFTQEKLFLAFLMNRCTAGTVRLVFDHLKKRMGTDAFLSVFENNNNVPIIRAPLLTLFPSDAN